MCLDGIDNISICRLIECIIDIELGYCTYDTAEDIAFATNLEELCSVLNLDKEEVFKK